MSDLQQEVAKLIEKANNGINSAGSFLQAELPEYIHQLLMWHAVESAVLSVLGVLFCVFWVWANVKQYQWWKREEPDDALLILNLSQVFLVLVPIETINLDWLQIWLAPKVWLVEYAAKLTS